MLIKRNVKTHGQFISSIMLEIGVKLDIASLYMYYLHFFIQFVVMVGNFSFLFFKYFLLQTYLRWQKIDMKDLEALKNTVRFNKIIIGIEVY